MAGKIVNFAAEDYNFFFPPIQLFSKHGADYARSLSKVNEFYKEEKKIDPSANKTGKGGRFGLLGFIVDQYKKVSRRPGNFFL